MEIETGCCENFKIGKVSSDTIVPEELQKLIDIIIKKEGFVTQNVKSKKVSTEGGNYLATLFEIDIKGKTKNEEKELNIFVKNIIPVQEDFNSLFSLSNVYATECYVYKELSNIFKKLQDEANVPPEGRYKIVKGYEESNSAMIILENVAKKGFVTYDRMKVIPLKFAELSIKELAKFHGLGFAMEKKIPDYFNKKIKNLKHPMDFNEAFDTFKNKLINTSIKNMTGNAKIKAVKFMPVVGEKYSEYILDKSAIRTLCHGDFRANNILMRESEGEVSETIPVDYQIVHYGNPVNDILYFINGCTDRAFRRQHMQNLLDMYYETLTSFLKYFDIDVKEVYPRDVFEGELKKRADLGLMIALMFYPFFFASEDNIIDLSEGFESVDVTIDGATVRRIEEFVEELEELGML